MSHRAGFAKPILSRGTTALVAAGIMAVVLGGIAVYNLPSFSGNTAEIPLKFGINKFATDAQGVSVTIPENSVQTWFSTKPLVFGFFNGKVFKLYPSGKFVEVTASGESQISASGDAPSNAFLVKVEGATKGEVVHVTVRQKTM